MNVAVLGARPRGRAITQLCVLAGHTVSLRDEEATVAMDGIDAVEGRLEDAVDAGQADAATYVGAVENLEATTGLGAAVADADAVIETATADAGALQERFAEVESETGRETLVATTADTSVTAAAAGLRHPDRAVGLRFQDPLERPLVEVVVADQTSGETAERATELVEGLDRSPVVVRDAPGGVSTRTILALEAEAMRLVETEIAGVAAVDDALELGYDHPVGPLEGADRAGLESRLATLEFLRERLGERFDPPEVLRELVAVGNTGMASGEGFYLWEDGEPTEPAVSVADIPGREDSPDDPGR